MVDAREPYAAQFGSLASWAAANTKPDDVLLSTNELSFAWAGLTGRKTLVSRAYFPDLSCPRGILVFEWSDTVDEEVRRELDRMGIGVATFGDPAPGEVFDVEGYKAMFAEWGWTGAEASKPAWME